MNRQCYHQGKGWQKLIRHIYKSKKLLPQQEDHT